MTSTGGRLLHAIDRFNATHPWDHNARFHPWILRRLPRRCGRALDVGCGSGDLVRALAARADTVDGIDADPRIVARAREFGAAESGSREAKAPRAGAREAGKVSYRVGDVLAEGAVQGPYDVVTCVAVLHHLPFEEALVRFRELLAPGGTLVVVGLAREAGPVDQVLGLASIPVNLAMAWLKNKGRTAPRPVAMTAPTKPAGMTYAETAGAARRLLPGARLRRHLLWRYSLVWRAPGA
ncbi:bifunctional 2-polyprenyl-6-hydroxyphenol methylase/3-demethylubiquinol 3-O-methyltransferase UbiG [Streptomyces sp. NRRL S-87]|uniref:class I SAM-dependent methyltransferase n=1 Tax=Streptomyces sp. NRRL S-87 TaxID=1463920 RepID=UPI0004BEAD7F|nr:class I SAM-dependent methyltransferase [Streptomyces sp. NRRL S-87]